MTVGLERSVQVFRYSSLVVVDVTAFYYVGNVHSDRPCVHKIVQSI